MSGRPSRRAWQRLNGCRRDRDGVVDGGRENVGRSRPSGEVERRGRSAEAGEQDRARGGSHGCGYAIASGSLRARTERVIGLPVRRWRDRSRQTRISAGDRMRGVAGRLEGGVGDGRRIG